MTGQSNLQSIEEIKQLKYRFCLALDSGDWEELANILTEDITLTFSREGLGTYQGISELELFKETIEQNRTFMVHMVTNPIINVEGESATGKWYYIVTLTDENHEAFWSQGIYDDVYRKLDGEWKIHRTEVTYNFIVPYSEGWSNRILTEEF